MPDLYARLELKCPPLLLLLAAMGLSWLIGRMGDFGTLLSDRAAVALALVLALAGVAVSVAGVLAFRRSGTSVDPTRPGRASALVRHGIYRYTRNPMYLGFALLLAGWGIFLGSVLACVPVPLFVAYLTRFQIMPEERVLLARFGGEFAAYRAQVHRWL
ncbi:isoprenylcysteine carboxylmethyltransferase family protein [Cupriavidus basilensis]|uniref:Isoprenylcysteine carboxylmethyltransferase family protein n=1 Tax=Cupriavidus basilensis TaxID=68895 RepID=A0ABT6AHC1_9BURK|nr:isoprenylcysteine carboxylmethyltransferase family protein [Cupriavidus basilensis]MDF3831997.1 isoprenylcysteine carboxylmethyltransferase family protein [Cupriavidus basilensis]